MATVNNSLANLATASLTSAMRRLMLDPDLADLTVTCGGKEWKVHSTILAVRSPFFKAAVTNNMAEKREMKIDIKEFDPNAMEEVLNFMYGVPKEKGPVQFLFEAAERFQMEDLKEYAVRFARKEMSVANVVEIGHAAELYSNGSFLAECAEFIVENDVPLTGEDTSPKLAVMVVNILKDANQKLNSDNQKINDAKQKLNDVHLELLDAYKDLNDVNQEILDANRELSDANQELKGKLQDSENELKVFFNAREVDWRRPHNIHLNGQLLEYVGPGRSGYNVGSAQSKTPLTTSNRYFEIEIIDFVEDRYIAIGLAREDYHINMLPGWIKGSIGYHADDGMVYMGSGVKDYFGQCYGRDKIIGCGVIFPCDYECKSGSEVEQEDNKSISPKMESLSGRRRWWCHQKVRAEFKPDSTILQVQLQHF